MAEPSSGTGTVLGRHRTPAADLDALAAGRLTPGTVGRLWAAERSRRMLMVRAVAESARGPLRGTPLPPDSALDLLLRVDRERPDVVVDLLEHPGTGIWAVRVLDRLRSGERAYDAVADTDGDVVPLWAEVGYLHCLAAAGALRAGTEGTIRLPVHGPLVVFPTVGRVRLPGPRLPDVVTLTVPPAGRGTALLVADGHRLPLPADLRRPDGAWEPARRIDWRPRPAARPLALEDQGPYRDFRSTDRLTSQPALTPGAAQRWDRLVEESATVLRDRHPHAADLLAGALRVLVPLPPGPRFRGASASFNEAVGSVVLSLPENAVELAVTLVHEARHSVLNGLLHQLPFCADEEPTLYAPWRGDPRPLSGALHGVYSFAGVADFWRVERWVLDGPAADLAHFEFAVWRAAVGETLRTVSTAAGLTDVGRLFVARTAEVCAAWETEPVPARAKETAQAESADLRAVWRARHRVPDPGAVRALTDAWLRGTDPDTAPRVTSRTRPAPGVATPDLRSELRRVQLAEPAALPERARHGRPESLAAADVHLLRGAAGPAVAGYRATLAGRPDSASAWAGLGLALSATGAGHAARALLRRPEVVRAVHEQAITATGSTPDPVAVADWIGRTPAGRDED